MKNVDSNQYGEIRGRLITKVGQEFGLRVPEGAFRRAAASRRGIRGASADSTILLQNALGRIVPSFYFTIWIIIIGK